MKHLFVINPMAYKIRGKLNAATESIEDFFNQNSRISHDIHVTRWERDAMGYVRRLAAKSGELLRVHVFGGSGTVFEVLNGVIGLPNIQIAAYPMGRDNYFLRYFGADKIHLFSSIRNQVFSGGVTPIDALRCGHNYGVAFGVVGIEAIANRDGLEMLEKMTFLPEDLCYIWAAVKNMAKSKKISQKYSVNIDGQILDGDYVTILIANGPCYGKDMSPAIDAHPNDGILDFYLMNDMSRAKFISIVSTYVSGGYEKLPKFISHYRGSKISIASDSFICVSVDGETFYENSIEYEIAPYAIDFVCPDGIDADKVPRRYGRPDNEVKG